MTIEATTPGKETFTPGRFGLKASEEIFMATFAYYAGLKAAKEEGRPVIWAYGVTPREIFHAVDAPVFYLEHVPFLLGFQQIGSHYMQIAEEHGFSKDVCTSHRCFIGCGLGSEQEREPILEGMFVEPDLIIAGNYPCMSESKAFLCIADRYDCPYYFIDTPINTWGKDPPDYAIEYFEGQLKGALDFMGEHGFNLDWDKLKETVRLSKQILLLFKEIDELRKAIPAPMSSMDGLVTALLLIQVLPPSTVITLYEKVLKEVKERVEKKEGALEEEKLRLMFFGVPPTFNMGVLDSVEKYGAVFAKSLLECAQGGMFDPSGIESFMDPEKPLESIAYRTLVDLINPTSEAMVNYMVGAVKDFNIDGVVAVVKRSCGLIPPYLRQIKDAVYKETGVPTTIFDLDGLDTRDYDDVTTRINLESFIETLLASKRR